MADKKISALTAATTPLTGSEVLPIVQSGSTVKVSVGNLTAGKNVTTAKVGAGGAPTTVFDAFAGTGADLNLRFSPAGWNTKHRLGVQFTGNGSVWSNNALMTSAADGDLDDVSNSGSALVQNTSGNLFFVTAAAGANPRTFTKRFDVDASGNFTVNTGNLVLGTAGKGIDFSANTHAAGMTSELLNDYEEGTFTPTFNTLTIGDGTLFGRYTKVGRVITCEFGFIFGSTSSFSGTVGSCGGFPYSSYSFGVDTYSIINGAAFDVGSNWYALSAYMTRGSNFCIGPAIGTTAPFTWAAGDTLVMTAIYEVA